LPDGDDLVRDGITERGALDAIRRHLGSPLGISSPPTAGSTTSLYCTHDVVLSSVDDPFTLVHPKPHGE